MDSKHSMQQGVTTPSLEVDLEKKGSLGLEGDPSSVSDEKFQKQPLTTVAIPGITDQFKSLPDIGWYASAYLMTSGAFQLMFGKIYSMYSVVTITRIVPLKNQPAMNGLLGAVFGIAIILGPLIGGALGLRNYGNWTPSGLVCVEQRSRNCLIDFYVVFGFGMGLSMQTPTIAIQAVLSTRDVPAGMALLFFGQLLGGGIGVPIGTTVLNTQLLKNLTQILPGFDRSLVTSGGVTALINTLPEEAKPAVLMAYNSALQDVFKVGCILTSLSFLGVASLEWKSTREGADNSAKCRPSEEERDDEVVEQSLTTF
ncbi:hypothetical protein N0V83_005522 [Neocucurbitaria cava]|uniref:Uncharacterized protein n=1 Tax=Neocucurbitaria cava TaxID=798079 RepID=A0A9W9CLQ9_9PLEO|nr:hypothetical protein N0V83_005522 [Neocucurbitaria cava]